MYFPPCLLFLSCARRWLHIIRSFVLPSEKQLLSCFIFSSTLMSACAPHPDVPKTTMPQRRIRPGDSRRGVYDGSGQRRRERRREGHPVSHVSLHAERAYVERVLVVEARLIRSRHSRAAFGSPCIHVTIPYYNAHNNRSGNQLAAFESN